MTTVWKFTWPRNRMRAEFDMPRGAEILFVREQREDICIWARVNPDEMNETREFALVGTGHSAPCAEDGRYVGSAMLQGGMFVFHVFEHVRA